jgi:hypothetical protein
VPDEITQLHDTERSAESRYGTERAAGTMGRYGEHEDTWYGQERPHGTVSEMRHKEVRWYKVRHKAVSWYDGSVLKAGSLMVQCRIERRSDGTA